MPTTQARLTRTHVLHATRSSIRSDNGMSSLQSEESRADYSCADGIGAHVPPPKFQDSDLRKPIAACFPAHMTCAPCHGHMCASGEPLGAAGTRRHGWESCVWRVSPMSIVLYSGYRPLRWRVAASSCVPDDGARRHDGRMAFSCILSASAAARHTPTIGGVRNRGGSESPSLSPISSCRPGRARAGTVTRTLPVPVQVPSPIGGSAPDWANAAPTVCQCHVLAWGKLGLGSLRARTVTVTVMTPA
jgi:hypothetical protein